MAKAKAFQALTTKFAGRANRILTDVTVQDGFDPTNPPSLLPTKVATKALWDTGATGSVISAQLAKQLGLSPVGVATVHTAAGPKQSPTYVVNFTLPNGVLMYGIRVTEWPGLAECGAIIGMDVITVGDFAITNVEGETWMSFRTPSSQRIDYVESVNRLAFQNVGRNDPCPCNSGRKFKQCHGRK